jgi:hypothetical protein
VENANSTTSPLGGEAGRNLLGLGCISAPRKAVAHFDGTQCLFAFRYSFVDQPA